MTHHAMTPEHSALLAQLDALKFADAEAVFAELIRAGQQALIEAEATETTHLGRALPAQRPTQHAPQWAPSQDGVTDLRRHRSPDPQMAGRLLLPIAAGAAPSYRQAVHAVIMEAYVHGVSSRNVDDLVGALGVGSEVSKSEASRICAGLDREIEAFRTRSLTHIQFPYVFCDATFCKVRVGAHMVSQALVMATGVSIDGNREVLGTAVGDSESFEFWREFLPRPSPAA